MLRRDWVEVFGLCGCRQNFEMLVLRRTLFQYVQITLAPQRYSRKFITPLWSLSCSWT